MINLKKIKIIALYEEVGKYYEDHLKSIFKNMIEVESCYIEGNPQPINLNADLILVTSHILYNHIKNFNSYNVDTLIVNRTFTKEGFNKLKKLKTDEEVLFVSTFYELAVECAAHLYELGIRDLKIIPYNPHSMHNKNEINITKAITAGESKLVPHYIKEVIDIGNRVIDISTIIDIGERLELPSESLNEIIQKYEKGIISSDFGLRRILDESNKFKNALNVILNFIPDSIIATDLEGNITEYNEASEILFKLEKKEVMGRKIDSVFDQLKITDVINKKRPITNVLLNIDNINIVTNKYPLLDDDGKVLGVIFISKKYMEIENEQIKLRSKLIPSGHVARHTFGDILGSSNRIYELKKVAYRMAKTDSTIFITGESGTGKEVFAQAIHNASNRKEKPFVAINCAALNVSLLESELFGYEEGSFTGAKKGGKIGLFEMANGGTIFLDEIGEIPPELQAKLLRVLDEKQVMRIGGTNVINVDTRIIAATNKDIGKAVEEGTFREDLYYRINVLPLKLPPLRERPEDIIILLKSFLNELGPKKRLSKEVIELLKTYSWPGNIRELRNCAEYMYQLSERSITINNIPVYVKEYMEGDPKTDEKINAFYSTDLNQDEQLVLNILYIFNTQGESVGRKAICEEIKKVRSPIPEHDVRFILKNLESRGLVSINLGRKGTEITKSGIKYIKEQLS